MKIFTLVAIFCLFALTPLFGLYNGNPAAPSFLTDGLLLSKEITGPLHYEIGYQRDTVDNRKLEARGLVRRRIDEFIIKIDQGLVILGLLQRAQLYASFGATRFYVRNRPESDERHSNYQSEDGFTWGVGGRVILYKWGDTTIGLNATYLQTQPRILWDSLQEGFIPSHSRLEYREYQVGVGLSHAFKWVVPYLAITYSAVYGRLTNIQSDVIPQTSFGIRSHGHPIGLRIGISTITHESLSITTEAGVISERGYILAGQLRF